MNEFSSIENNQGLLKQSYDDTVSKALKKKREKLAETKLGLIREDEEKEE